MSGGIAYAADLVRAHVDALRRSADAVLTGRTGAVPSFVVPELGGIDAAFSDVSAAVAILRQSSGETLMSPGDKLADALGSMISVEEDIVQLIARALGTFA